MKSQERPSTQSEKGGHRGTKKPSPEAGGYNKAVNTKTREETKHESRPAHLRENLPANTTTGATDAGKTQQRRASNLTGRGSI